MDDKLTLWGKNVFLRSLRLSDVEDMVNWSFHDDELFYDYNFPYLDEHERLLWYELKTKKNKRCFCIFNRSSILVGYIAIRNVRVLFKSAEMGIVFDPDYVNKGYGTDAIKTLLKWYFNTLGYRKLILSVAAYNERAIRAYKKVGFQTYHTYYDQFMNPIINPLEDDRYMDIRKYFRKKGNNIQVLHYKMQISTLSTD